MADYSDTIIRLEISRKDYAPNNILRCFENEKITNADIVLFKSLLHQSVGQVMKQYPSTSIANRSRKFSTVTQQVSPIYKRICPHNLKFMTLLLQ